MGNPVVYFEVLGKDHEALNAFYSELFGWTASPVGDAPYSVVDTGADGSIPGGVGEAADGTEHVTFYVEVDDLDAALRKAESLGGRQILGPTDFPGGSFAQFADPEGHTIGLWKGAAGD
jgi:predicted enzyme related to lactoylglutathione lyase